LATGNENVSADQRVVESAMSFEALARFAVDGKELPERLIPVVGRLREERAGETHRAESARRYRWAEERQIKVRAVRSYSASAAEPANLPESRREAGRTRDHLVIDAVNARRHRRYRDTGVHERRPSADNSRHVYERAGNLDDTIRRRA
jgi:hypothetical protein